MTEVINADGIAAVGSRGPAFENLSFTVDEHQLAVVIGPGGSGRSSLLLALSGRLPLVTGRLSVFGDESSGRLRRHSALASAGPAFALDPHLSIDDHIAERRVTHGVDPERVDDHLAWLGLEAIRSARASDVSPAQRILFLIALAASEDRPLLLVDDADENCVDTERAEIWSRLAELTRSGMTIVATAALAPQALDAPLAIIELPGHRRRESLAMAATTSGDDRGHHVRNRHETDAQPNHTSPTNTDLTDSDPTNTDPTDTEEGWPR